MAIGGIELYRNQIGLSISARDFRIQREMI